MRRALALIFLLTTQLLQAEVQPPKTPFNDYLVAPLRVHRLVTPGELNLTTTLEEKGCTKTMSCAPLSSFCACDTAAAASLGACEAFRGLQLQGSLGSQF